MRHRITDDEVLELILSGRLRAIRIQTRNPIIVKDGRRLRASIVPGKSNPRYRVEICLPRRPRSHKRRKRTIMRAKLVWMIHNRRTVPYGCHIDHDDEDRFNDAARNLNALTHSQHEAKHGYYCDDSIPA